MPLTLEKMNYLIKELFRTENPLKCPHGRPTVLQFSQLAIERGFDRR
jgi:DNA mismatch repair protein MutL